MKRLPYMMLAVLLLAAACRKRDENSPLPVGNAMYFWRTAFSLDSAERRFIHHQKITRLYIRFFDVVTDSDNPLPHPNATLRFPDTITSSPLPRGVDYVPVVFITPECLDKADLPGLAAAVVRRTEQMAAANYLPPPAEIQIDCDWTSSTRRAFLSFMKALKAGAAVRSMATSVTIRLHQLAQEAPAADYGVLMVYNTGNLTRPGQGNPILTKEAVQPYMPRVAGYPLPLVAAYPNFRWPVVYSHGKYEGILYGFNPSGADSSLFRRTGDSQWTAIATRSLPVSEGAPGQTLRITPGSRLCLYSPPPLAELLDIKKALTRRRPDMGRCTILFDLNRQNLDIYSSQQYEQIFAR